MGSKTNTGPVTLSLIFKITMKGNVYYYLTNEEIKSGQNEKISSRSQNWELLEGRERKKPVINCPDWLTHGTFGPTGSVMAKGKSRNPYAEVYAEA